MSTKNKEMKKIAGTVLAAGLIIAGGAYTFNSFASAQSANADESLSRSAAQYQAAASTNENADAPAQTPAANTNLNIDGLPIANVTPEIAKQIAFLTPVANPSPAVLQALIEISTFGSDNDPMNPKGSYGVQTISDSTAKALAAEAKSVGHSLQLTACSHDNYFADANGVIYLNDPDQGPNDGVLNATK